ncbi:hypothetical protein GOP47_0030065 [Adiantum capillus-veneris]|nr:hypothetical protein GOP47_0030065 [Adiantum capillus-veneris]
MIDDEAKRHCKVPNRQIEPVNHYEGGHWDLGPLGRDREKTARCCSSGEMQFLRRVTVNIQKNYIAAMRAYGTGSTACGGSRKSKEERVELVVEFVSKYQASHSGEFPSLSLVRKEVGGKYETLKEILHSLQSMKQTGKLEGSSSVILSGSEKPPIAERAVRKGLKNCTNLTEAECVTDRTTTKAIKQRVEIDFGVAPSQSGKVENGCGAAASKDHAQSPQQMTLSEVDPREGDFMAEFPLFIHGVSVLTTPKDLREAFQDCGEIWNAATLEAYRDHKHPKIYTPPKVRRMDAIVNFKVCQFTLH